MEDLSLALRQIRRETLSRALDELISRFEYGLALR